MVGAVLALSSCQTLEFYSQAASGQMEILSKSKPIQPMIASKDTDP